MTPQEAMERWHAMPPADAWEMALAMKVAGPWRKSGDRWVRDMPDGRHYAASAQNRINMVICDDQLDWDGWILMGGIPGDMP